jgi:hypothetical protein
VAAKRKLGDSIHFDGVPGLEEEDRSYLSYLRRPTLQQVLEDLGRVSEIYAVNIVHPTSWNQGARSKRGIVLPCDMPYWLETGCRRLIWIISMS